MEYQDLSTNRFQKVTMITNIVIGIAALVGLFLCIVALRPTRFRVSRSETISASPERVFAEVNNLRRWDAWSPWEKLDPKMIKTFEGPECGTGAVTRWEGNSQVGAGSNTIIESRPFELIQFRLEMLRPFVGTNDVEFAFQPNGTQTKVSWTMVGNLNFITKAMDMFIGMDKMVGDQFSRGLADLKKVAEAIDNG